MKKQYIKFGLQLFAIALLAVFINSCNEDETLDRAGKPTITLAQNSTTVTEGMSPSMIFNISYPITKNADIRVQVVGGTAIEGEDYDFNIDSDDSTATTDTVEDAGGGFFGGDGYYVVMPAYTTTFDLSNFITTYADSDSEGDETIELQLFSMRKGYALINQRFTINISDYSASRLGVTLKIDDALTIDGNDYTVCQVADLDLFISSSDVVNDDLQHMWDGPCNEVLSPDMDNDPNNWGVQNIYYVWIDFWAFGNLSVTTPVNIPFDLVFTKTDVASNAEVFSETLTISDLYATDSATSSTDPNFTAGMKLAAKIEILGNTFTITDLSGNVVASGKMSSTAINKRVAAKKE